MSAVSLLRLERFDAAGLLQRVILDMRLQATEERDRCLNWWSEVLGPDWLATERRLVPLSQSAGYLVATGAFRRTQGWRQKGFTRLGDAVRIGSHHTVAKWKWIARSYADAVVTFTDVLEATSEVRAWRNKASMRFPRDHNVFRALYDERSAMEKNVPVVKPELSLHQWFRLEDLRSHRSALQRRDAALLVETQKGEGEAIVQSKGSWEPNKDSPTHERILAARRVCLDLEMAKEMTSSLLSVDQLEKTLDQLRLYLRHTSRRFGE